MTGWAKILACTLLLAGSAGAVQPGAANSFAITEKSFHCMTEMTRVGHFYVDNLAGNLKGTVQIAALSLLEALAPVSTSPKNTRPDTSAKTLRGRTCCRSGFRHTRTVPSDD